MRFHTWQNSAAGRFNKQVIDRFLMSLRFEPISALVFSPPVFKKKKTLIITEAVNILGELKEKF